MKKKNNEKKSFIVDKKKIKYTIKLKKKQIINKKIKFVKNINNIF